jgi:hypothetical protein
MRGDDEAISRRRAVGEHRTHTARVAHDILRAIAGELLIANDDPTLKSIYKKSSETDFDARAEDVIPARA